MEGQVLGGRYRIEREIGAGGMGVVYEAIDETLDHVVALKLLRPFDGQAPRAVARLEREARAAAALGHPNIVRVTDFGRIEGGGAFLVMERLTGRALDEELATNGRMGVERAVRAHLQLLDALATAHAAGVLHRDVKPANVFLTQLADGTELVKLLDFGLAYLLEESASPKLTHTGVAIGTPAYMAPERLYGKPLDARADLYAVAVTLYESLTGELPFDAPSAIALRGKVLLEDAPDVREWAPDVGEVLAAVLTRGLAKNPDDRFEDAAAMAEALAIAVTGPDGSAAEISDDTIRALPPVVAAGDAIDTQDTLLAMEGAPRARDGEPVLVPPPAEAEPAPLKAPMAAATLPQGGVTVPHAGPQTAPTHAAAPRPQAWGGLARGLALGAGLGVIALGALGAIALWRNADPPPPALAPAAPVARAQPAAQASSREAPGDEATPQEAAAEGAPDGEPRAELPDGLEPGADPAGDAPAAPTARHRRRRAPAPLPTPRPLPPSATDSRPQPIDPNRPLAPPGW